MRPAGPGDAFFSESRFVAKSFILPIANVGSLHDRSGLELPPAIGLNPYLLALTLTSQFTADGNFADDRLWSFLNLVIKPLNLKAFQENPLNANKDGEYRLYTSFKIKAPCCGEKLILDTEADKEGGYEVAGLSGTMNMTSSKESVSDTTTRVRWRGWGRPNLLLEPGMQWVASRTSVNIWHDVTVVVPRQNRVPSFALEQVRRSGFRLCVFGRTGPKFGRECKVHLMTCGKLTNRIQLLFPSSMFWRDLYACFSSYYRLRSYNCNLNLMRFKANSNW